MRKTALRALEESRERVPLSVEYQDWSGYIKKEKPSCYYRPKNEDSSSLQDPHLLSMLNR